MPTAKTPQQLDTQEKKDEMQDLLFSLVSGAPVGILALSLGKKILVCNQETLNILQKDLKVNEVIDKPVDAVFKDLPFFLEALDESYSKGRQAFNIPNLYHAKKFVSIRVRKMKEGMLIFFDDITELIEKERAETVLKQQMIIDKMKSDFVSVASHQLRTPLTALGWNIETLLAEKRGKLTEKQKKALEEMRISNNRMVQLVSELLNLSRIESGKLFIMPVSTKLEQLVKNSVKDVRELAKKKQCNIRTIFPETKLSPIPIDPTLFSQVLHNLLTNAIKYSGQDTCNITVELKKVARKYYLLSVKDQGIGIPENVQSKIFKKFTRADNAMLAESEGSGLGLYIAKLIMEQAGGDIWFESTENKGSTFYVAIPLSGMKPVTAKE